MPILFLNELAHILRSRSFLYFCYEVGTCDKLLQSEHVLFALLVVRQCRDA